MLPGAQYTHTPLPALIKVNMPQGQRIAVSQVWISPQLPQQGSRVGRFQKPSVLIGPSRSYNEDM